MIFTINKHCCNRTKQIYYAVSPQGCILVLSYDTPVFFCQGDRFIRMNAGFIIFQGRLKMPVFTHYFGHCVFTAEKIYRKMVNSDSSYDRYVRFS